MKYGVKLHRADASCLLNIDRKLAVWKNGDLIIFSINGSSVALHTSDALRIYKEMMGWITNES